MSKYNRLSERLSAHSGDEWRLSFSELESVLGFPLPRTARTGRAWWANDPDRRHSRAWTAQGWEVGDVDHAAERVVFRKRASSAAALVEAAHLQPLADPAKLEPLGAPAPAPGAASEIQPPAMREAAEAASAQMHAIRKLGGTAIMAVTAALGTFLVRRLMRRRKI